MAKNPQHEPVLNELSDLERHCDGARSSAEEVRRSCCRNGRCSAVRSSLCIARGPSSSSSAPMGLRLMQSPSHALQRMRSVLRALLR